MCSGDLLGVRYHAKCNSNQGHSRVGMGPPAASSQLANMVQLHLINIALDIKLHLINVGWMTKWSMGRRH
jgi:hypothetical protein